MTGREEAAGRWDEQPVVAHGTVVVATARRQLRPDSLGRNVVYRRSARPIAALGIVFCGLRISLPTRPRWEYPEYAHIAETSAVKIALISPEPEEALGPNRALPPENEGFAVPTSEYALYGCMTPTLRQGILFNSATPLKCLYSRMRDGLSLGSHNHPYRPRRHACGERQQDQGPARIPRRQ
jgi:hypothetical protein